MQSIAPLKVSTEQEVIITDLEREAARAAGLTVEQYLGLEDIAASDVIPARKFVKGEPLVKYRRGEASTNANAQFA